MLGYLSLNETLPVDGLKKDDVWQASFENNYASKNYKLFPIPAGATPCSDPEHDRQSISTQIGTAALGQPSMGGFGNMVTGDCVPIFLYTIRRNGTAAPALREKGRIRYGHVCGQLMRRLAYLLTPMRSET